MFVEGKMEGTLENHAGAIAPASEGDDTRVQIRDRIKEFRRVKACDLVRNPKNWRRHPKAQAEALRGLLTEIGYADALIVRELTGHRLMIIDGHLRADTTPEMLVPVLVLDVSEEEADKILLTLDPLATLAETDAERMKALIEAVSTESSAVEDLIKRTAGEEVWSLVHPENVAEVEVELDRAEELRAKWATEINQVWQAGAHRLICGDSRNPDIVDRLLLDARFRLIWTDPPYGVSYGAKTNWLHTNGGGRGRRAIANDSLPPAELQLLFGDALKSAVSHALPGASIYATVPSQHLKFFIQGLEDGGFSYRHCLVWIKQNFVMGRADYHYRHEPILYGWLANGPHFFIEERDHDSVFEIDRPAVSELHPTTKPVELIAEMIKNSSLPGDLVYDPFTGSGSTIVAAHQLGRVGYGCELDPGYVAVQLERLSLLGLKPELLK
jgi:DNA modification methylase